MWRRRLLHVLRMLVQIKSKPTTPKEGAQPWY
jgi:hypothetical protein